MILGLLSGFVTLSILGGGGYYLWHTHSKVQAIEKRISDAEVDRKKMGEIARTRPLNVEEQNRLFEASKTLENIAPESNEAQKYRAYALGGVVTFVIPAFVTVAFFIMFLVKWLRARKADKAAAEEDDYGDEAEMEEAPAAKNKPKPMPADDE